MSARQSLVLLVMALLFATCAEARRAAPPAPSGKRGAVGEADDLEDLHQEVAALQMLYDLRVTAEQREALGKLARKTVAPSPPRRDVKVSGKYRKAMLALRDALAAADPETVEQRVQALDELREKEAPELEEPEVTEAARKHAPGFVRLLSARQVAVYAGGLGDAFPSPREKLTEALAKARELRGKEWRSFRDAAAEDVAWLLAGLDERAEGKVRAQALALLNKAHRLDEKELAAQKAALEKEARDLAGKVGAFDVLRNYMERSVADLLSNPRLPAALARRAAKKRGR
jgi:hypothetical protein